MAAPPLTRRALTESLGEKIAEAFRPPGGATTDASEQLGAVAAAQAVEYFADSLEGADPAGLDALVQFMVRAVWDGTVPDAEIEAFFRQTGISIPRLFGGWRSAREGNPQAADFTIVVLPGKMTDLEVTTLAEQIFLQRQGGPAPKK